MLEENRESTRWRYRLTDTEVGTELTESFEFVWCPLAHRVGELFLPRGRVMRRGLNDTLHRIKAAAESEATTIEDSDVSQR
jgi:hypothetical protein